MIFSIIDSNVTDISSEVFQEDGQLKLLSYEEWAKYPFDSVRMFCHKYGRYGIPTLELIAWLRDIIGDRSAIEVGSGAGDLGYHLKIPCTDSRSQELPIIRDHYEKMGQPVIKYPSFVEKIDGLEAVRKYKADVVIGSWITTYSPFPASFPSSPIGFKEDEILKLCETFVIIGNFENHGNKPIRKFVHKQLIFPWLLSRERKQENNLILLFEGGIVDR